MAVVSLVALLVAFGCSTTGSGGGRTLKQVDMDVSWAMTRFRNGVAAGAVTLGEKEQVNGAYTAYQTAYRDALQAAQDNRNTPAPDNVKTLANQVLDAISAIPF
jgi:hypothetical protein